MSDTVIVLQEECILAASGKAGRRPRISRTDMIPTEVHTDPFEQWKRALLAYKAKEHPGSVKLVLPSNYSSTRISQIPFATGKQLTKMAEHVVSESAAEGIVDYGITYADKKQGVTVCCASVEENICNRLLAMCEEINLPVRAITVPMEAYLRGLSQLKTYANKTAIFLFFEDSGVTSILYKNGVYLYSTRSRIFSERGTLDFGTEIVRNISGIVQFYATTTSGIPITDIYYAGCMEDDFEVCLDGIHMMNLQAALLQVDAIYETQGNPEDWLVCAGALVDDKTKQVNLYQKWKKFGGMDKVVEKESFVKHIVPPVLTLAVCMALFGAVSVWNLLESKKIDDINDWINDSQIQQQYQEADEVMKESERLVEQKQQVEQMKQNLATYPDLDADIIARIVDVSGSNMNVEVKSMDAETGLLTFHAVSSAVIDIPGYVNKLTQTGLFSSVDYSGYQYQDGEYTLDLSCILKAIDAGGDK